MDLLNSPKEVMLDVLLFLTVIGLAIQDAMIVLKTYIWSVKLMHLAIQNVDLTWETDYLGSFFLTIKHVGRKDAKVGLNHQRLGETNGDG